MNRSDFQRLVGIRLREARTLLKGRHYAGSYYLAGYIVECALKACIAAKTKSHDFPPKPDVVREYYKHDLSSLVRLAGLELELRRRYDSMLQFKLN